MWIEIIQTMLTPFKDFSRGSREPCGLKYLKDEQAPVIRIVEARESLVD